MPTTIEESITTFEQVQKEYNKRNSPLDCTLMETSFKPSKLDEGSICGLMNVPCYKK